LSVSPKALALLLIAPLLCASFVQQSAEVRAQPSQAVASGEGHAIGVLEVKKHLAGALSKESLEFALREAVKEALLREEAHAHLDAEDAIRSDAPKRLLTQLFSPSTLCARIPERLRRQHYDANLWRLQMPKAWRVSAIEWVCCKGEACRHPAASQCRNEGEIIMTRLSHELPAQISDEDFGAVFDEKRPGEPRLRFRRYTFFYDEAHPPHPLLRYAPKALSDALVKTPEGELTPPLPTQEGYTILRLRSTQEHPKLTWDDPRTQALLRTELCPFVWQRAMAQYTDDLLTQSSLRIDFEAIKAEWGITLRRGAPQ